MTYQTTPNDRFEKLSKQLTNHIKTAFQMGVDAAKLADADKFGINERISVAHAFVDLEVKGHAEMLETLIGGPLVDCGPYEDYDTIYVEPTNDTREVKILGTHFVRVGLTTKVKLPVDKLKVVPNILAPGVGEFRIYLNDFSYIGANYRGSVELVPINLKADEKRPPPIVVTAGL